MVNDEKRATVFFFFVLEKTSPKYRMKVINKEWRGLKQKTVGKLCVRVGKGSVKKIELGMVKKKEDSASSYGLMAGLNNSFLHYL